MWWCIITSMLAAADPVATDLAPPVPLYAGGQPINVDMGHAAPFVAVGGLTPPGWPKGDDQIVLLVGQFGQGKLRLYPNIGTRREPKFDQFEWFQAGGKVASVPAG
jgi:hypothetical protein